MKQEEKELFRRAQFGDRTARSELASRYVELVAKPITTAAAQRLGTKEEIARWAGKGFAAAIDLYNTDGLSNFETYADLRIRGAIQDGAREKETREGRTRPLRKIRV